VPDSPPTARTLVGRADELAALSLLVGLAEPGDRSVGAAAERPARAVLLGGDAGVGKTRLLAELREQALSEGWRVLVGHCLDFGGDWLPYLPFSDAFGRLAVEEPDEAASLLTAVPG
jgi:predicted ATPase